MFATVARRKRKPTPAGLNNNVSATRGLSPPSPKSSLRYRIWLTLDDPSHSRMARYSSTFVIVVIAVSVINFIVGTERFPKCAFSPAGFSPEVAYMCGAGKLSDSGSPLAEFLNGLETFCIMVFTVEYVLRILTCTTKMRIHHFVLAPMNVIDLIAILPWYLDLVLAVLKVEVSVEALSLLRVVRLTRVVRIFKMSKKFQGLIVLGRSTPIGCANTA